MKFHWFLKLLSLIAVLMVFLKVGFYVAAGVMISLAVILLLNATVNLD